MTEILIVMEINYTFFKSGRIWIPFAPSCLQNLEIQMPENNLSSVSYGDLINRNVSVWIPSRHALLGYKAGTKTDADKKEQLMNPLLRLELID